MSGILISKLPEDEKTFLSKKYGIDHIPTIIYCIAKQLPIPTCEICNNSIQLISAAKGFRKYCSKKCCLEVMSKNNEIHNKQKNILRGEKITLNNQKKLLDAQIQYLKPDNKLNIQEIAELYSVTHFQFRKFLLKNDNIRKDLRKQINEMKWREQNKFLFNGTLASLINDGYGASYIAEKFNISTTAICVYAKKQNINWKSKSTYELKISEFLDSLNIVYVKNTRKIIAPKELDIFIPEHNLAIEINGEYWHSDEYKDKNYHISKQIECESRKIHLMQFFAHEIDGRWEHIQNIIKTHLKLNNKSIYARKTYIQHIDKKTTKEFLDSNHLHGHISCSLSIGLFHDGNLVSVATFGKPRFNKNYDLELFRFCSLKGVNVVGGLSKIISYISKHENKSLITYSHRRIFSGQGYINSGFKLLKHTTVGYFWFSDKHGIISRYNTQKHKLNTKLTENEYMRLAGFMKIYDCGQSVFVLEHK